MNAKMKERYDFHKEHGGWSVPPGRAACALEAARDEAWLDEMVDAGRASFRIEYDNEPYDPGDVCTDEEARAKFDSNEWTGPFGCIVGLNDDDHAASLWGIVVGPKGEDDPYIRVVRAELAGEVRAQYETEERERTRAANMDVATV